MIHSMREGRMTPYKKGKINRMGVMIHTLGVGGELHIKRVQVIECGL